MKKKVLGLLLAACMAVPTTAMTMGTITVSAEENVEAAESLAVSADVDEEEPLVGDQADGFLCTSFGIERGTMNDDGTVAKEGVEGFVDRLYSKVMGRTADASGIQMWVGQITSGKMSAEEVAKSFFNSTEYINKNASNEQFVLTLYETFMGRSADEAGKNMWLEQLNSRSMTRTEVLEGFSRSNEFKAILAGYGL